MGVSSSSPPSPRAQRGYDTPLPITLQLPGWAEQDAWARVLRVGAGGSEEDLPHSCPPAGRGRAEVASASSCRDRAAVTLQMLTKVIGGPGEGDEEKKGRRMR